MDRSDHQPLLARALAALDDAGARWCLLRGSDEPGSDVDLLIDADDGRLVEGALDGAGFLLLRAWGGQRFFLALDPTDRAWVVLHVAERLAFGRRYEFDLDRGAGCLDRARRAGGRPVVSPADEFWIVLLHGLLDKGGLAMKHRRRLAEVVAAASIDDQLASAVADAIGPSEPDRLLERAAMGDWDGLEAMAAPIRRAWSSRHRLAVASRRLRHGVGLASRKAVEPIRQPGLRVALLAPDGAGKTTIARSVVDSFFFGGRVVYLGLYGAQDRVAEVPVPGAGFVQRVIRMRWRSSVGAYHAARRRLVVFDRHPLDAVAHGPGRTGLRRRLLAASAPKPDLLVVLDAPAPVLHARKQEHPVDRLEVLRQGYLALAARTPGAVVIDATPPADEVASAVLATIWAAYLGRRRAHP